MIFSDTDTGKLGESIAQKYLLSKGYQLLETNWRHKRSEIDIICIKEDVLTFIEVKTSHSGLHYDPASRVDQKKVNMLKAAAHAFMESNKYEWAFQFDIVAVILHDQSHEILHYTDAFY
jgi:putative endonuclease